MESPPPLETVYQAVVTLYHNQNWSEREKASQWLGELQQSVSFFKNITSLILKYFFNFFSVTEE